MKRRLNNRTLNVCILAFALVAAMSSAEVGAKNERDTSSPGPIPAATPGTYSGYKGVKIGMSTDDARKLLGLPKEKGDVQDYFVYSDNETAQVVYDNTHQVITVSVTYIGKISSVPTPKDIFGEDAAAKPDGSIMKMVRYPKNGYWISYNRTAGDDPIVMITTQKIFGNADN